MNKKMKIITLILSCVLLIGAAVGITVSAEQNPPTVSIAGQNISYEGAVKVAYYIPAAGLEGYTVKVLSRVSETFTYEKTVGQTLTYSEDVVVSEATDKVTIEGVEYLIGYSEGIAPKKLRDNVYSVAIVVDDTDTIVAVSKNKKYSVYQYAMNRFKVDASVETTTEQYALYTALLNYGGAVQDVLGYNAVAGSYADEYIVVNQKTYTDGAEANTSFAIRGTTLENPVEYKYEAARWQQADAEKEIAENKSVIFTGFTNADGSSYFGDNYAANWNKKTLKPGEYTINANYATEPNGGHYQTYDGQVAEGATTITGVNGVVSSSKGFFAENGSTDTSKESIGGIDYTITYYYQGYARFENEQLVFGKQYIIKSISYEVKNGEETVTNYVNSIGDYKVGGFYTTGTKTAGVTVNQSVSTTSPYGTATAITKGHVVEFDMKVDSESCYKNETLIAQLFFDSNNQGYHILGFNILADNAGVRVTVESQNGGIDNGFKVAEHISYDEVHTYRFEYYVDANGEGTMAADVYIDGKYASTVYNNRTWITDIPNSYTNSVVASLQNTGNVTDSNMNTASNTDEKLAYFGFFTPTASKTTTIYVDDIYVGTVYDEGYLGRGKYQNVATTNFEDDKFTGIYTSTTGGKFTGADKKTDDYTYAYITVETDETTGNKYLQHNARNDSRHLYFKNEGDTSGNVYVFAFDFKWDGSAVSYDAAGEKAVVGNKWTRYAAAQYFFGMVAPDAPDYSSYFYRVYATSVLGEADGKLYLSSSSLDKKYWANDANTKEGDAINDPSIASDAEMIKGSFAALDAHKWYNIRMEYTPSETQDPVNNSGTYKVYGKLSVYVNGDLVYTELTDKAQGEWTVAKSNSKKWDETTTLKNIDNDNYGYGFFNARGADVVTDCNYCLDNVYVNAISTYGNTVEDMKPTGPVYAGALDYDYTEEVAAAGVESYAALDAATLGFSITGLDGRMLGDVVNKTVTLTSSNKTSKIDYTNPNNDAARVINEGDNEVLELTSRSTSTLVSYFTAQQNEGDKYVFSTNLKWVGSSSIQSLAGNNPWMFKLGLESTYTDAQADTKLDSGMLTVYGYMVGENDLDLYLRSFDAEGNVVHSYIDRIYNGQWMNISIEYTPGEISGRYTGTADVIVNGTPKLLDAPTATEINAPSVNNDDIKHTFIEMCQYARDAVLILDDTFCGAVDTIEAGNGKYAGADSTYKFNVGEGVDYTIFNNDVDDISVYSFTTSEGVLTYSKVKENVGSMQPYFRNPYAVSEPKKVTYEMDIKILSENFKMREGYENEWAMKLFIGTSANNIAGQALLIPVYSNLDGTLGGMIMDIAETVVFIPADEWHNIRMEVDNDNHMYVYLDGVLRVTTNNAADLTKELAGNAGAEIRRYTATSAFQFDNVYVGSESDTVDTFVDTPKSGNGYATFVNGENGITNISIDRSKVTTHASHHFTLAELPEMDSSDLRIGDVITADFSMKINNVVNNYSSWLLYMGFGREDYLSNFDSYTSTVTLSMASRGKYDSNYVNVTENPAFKNGYLTYGSWHHIQNVLKVTDIDKDSGELTVAVYMYVDGNLQISATESKTFNSMHDIANVCVKMKSTTNSSSSGTIVKYDIDFTNVAVSISHNGGAEYGDDFVNNQTGQITADFDETGAVNGNLTEHTSANKGNVVYVDADGNVIEGEDKSAAVDSFFRIANGANGSGEIRYFLSSKDALGETDTTALGAMKSGSQYEVSFKFRLNAIDTPSGKDDWKSWFINIGIGDSTVLNTNWNNANVNRDIYADSAAGTMSEGDITIVEGTSEWHEITFRIAVADYTKKTFDYWVIIDGELARFGYNQERTAITGIDSFAFKFKGASAVSYSVDFDDFKLTAFNTTVATPAETPAE